MRNIFDQYSQNENRLTHAFASALHEDSELRADFINRFLSRGVKPRIGSVRIAEQSYPGFPQMSEQDAEAASIPDIWLYDEDSAWCVVVECKITASLTSGQVQRHIRTARQRGFETILPVTISIAGPHDALPSGTVELRWSMIYEWLHEHSGTSVWATHAARYFETLEAQMAEAGQLGDGTLTTFTGFGFAKPEDYSYPEAKRLLRLALEQLREDKDLINVLGMDPALPGRGAITGSDADGVWDYLQLSQARGAAHHTNHPHLTLGVHRREIEVMVTLPNSMQRPLRGRLKAIGLDGFTELLAQILGRLSGLLSKEPNAIPTVRTVQRRYRTLNRPGFAGGSNS